MQTQGLAPRTDDMFAHEGLPSDPPPQDADRSVRFDTHAVDAPGRAAVEALIATVYRTRYAAQPREFAPVLVSLSSAQGPLAAAGYRPARSGRLFLERYLDGPIEHLLPPTARGPIARSTIVEVGHLAALRAGDGRRLLYPLARHLADEGYAWVVSTVTRELRQLFLRLGITPLAIAPADPQALGDDRVDWGRYFEHEPVILAGHLPLAIGSLVAQRRIAREDARSRRESS